MRKYFVEQMIVEMENNPDIIFLTGDLGFNALEPIRERFPDRFINVGIAEQNMVGLASGLALEGKKVIAYSIASFASMRPYEQIRDNVCYDNLDVKIVGTGGGVNYATLGITHHTIEDLAIMNVLPNMKVLSPAYSWEAKEATKAMMKDSGPVYIRLGKSPDANYGKADFAFEFGKGFVIRPGRDIVLVSTGNILDIVEKTADMTEKATGKTVAVISMPSIKPFDEKLIVEYAKIAEGVFTIEEHSVIGGLGSIVSSILWNHSVPKKHFHSFGFNDVFVKEVGSREYLLSLSGIDSDMLTQKIVQIMSCK
jgi:transketolase